jgi:hypothetical protein
MWVIFKEIHKKPLEYILLLSIFIVAAILFFIFSFDPHAQRRIIYGLAAAYFAWSMYHHYKRGDLQTSIILEYLLFALFAVILISTTIF